MPVVRALVQALADEVADAEGRPHVPVPDLGPAVVMDQLRVVMYDVEHAGMSLSAWHSSLTELRRKLV